MRVARRIPRRIRLDRIRERAQTAQQAQVPGKEALAELFPERAYQELNRGQLEVGEGHSLHWRTYGNPAGAPALVLHGGPGAGCTLTQARFFDPNAFFVVLVDQRGCGSSVPLASTSDNLTENLVSDLELLRQHLGLSSWLLFGGSWGTTLALAYARRFPRRVWGMVLRGICLFSRREIAWLHGDPAADESADVDPPGASFFFPGAWRMYLAPLSPEERKAPLKSHYLRLRDGDKKTRESSSDAFFKWVMSPYQGVIVPPDSPPAFHINYYEQVDDDTVVPFNLPGSEDAEQSNGDTKAEAQKEGNEAEANSEGGGEEKKVDTGTDYRYSGSQAHALVELHYSYHQGGELQDEPLLESAEQGAFDGIPAIGLQGTVDMVTPPQTAYELSARWEDMALYVLPNTGHPQYDVYLKDAQLRSLQSMYQEVYLEGRGPQMHEKSGQQPKSKKGGGTTSSSSKRSKSGKKSGNTSSSRE
jgi:proline iminopeptidase